MKREMRVAAVLLPIVIAGCAQAPLETSSAHIRAEAPAAEGQIPPPVQLSPLLPKPKPSARPETYSVVVSNVRVQELLFALARDARMQIDIDPTLTGSVTLNAIDQTLPQLLQRISRQVEMRYEIDGQNLIVSRDAPFLRSYKIDYLSASRNVKMQSTASTQFGTGVTSASVFHDTTPFNSGSGLSMGCDCGAGATAPLPGAAFCCAHAAALIPSSSAKIQAKNFMSPP